MYVWEESHGSKALPTKCVINGSDASAWSLSHFAQVTHDTQAAKKVKSKVYGIIVHGY